MSKSALSGGTRIYVAGHRGMVGSALVRLLQKKGCTNLLLRTRAELDLTNQAAVRAFFAETGPEVVLMAAARVGGIQANNTQRTEFIHENLSIQTNVIGAAHATGVDQLLFLGSSCVYPRDCPQPIREEHLLTGPLEFTNEPYAIAKIAGIKLCESIRRQYGRRYFSVMPTNLYGPNDNYDLETSHVLPALLAKAHALKVAGGGAFHVWGSGRPRREFLHVDDLADACLFLLESDAVGVDLLNIGSGVDVIIQELAEQILQTVGLKAPIVFDATKPDGTPRKLLDVSRVAALGWKHSIDLQAGLATTYRSMLGAD